MKASEPNKLWSNADLCARKKSKANTSIYEISIARDKHREKSRFRIVTLRPVVSGLKMLTIPFGKPRRETNEERFKALQSELDERFPNLKSPKGHGSAYWFENCLWNERHSEEVLYQTSAVFLDT